MLFNLPPQTATPLAAIGFSIPSKEYLVKQYVGKKLHEVRTPRMIVDRSVVQRNCERLGAISAKSGKRVRVHIKTHKVSVPKITKWYDEFVLEPDEFYRLLKVQRCS